MSFEAIPLYLPTGADLEEAHAIFEIKEPRAYAWDAARAIMTDGGSTAANARAIYLLLKNWNPRSSYSRNLTVDATATLLESTTATRAVFSDRGIESLDKEDHAEILGVYRAFQMMMGQVGAAKALALLYPRFFPLWDNPIAKAHLGSTCLQPDRAADSYVSFMVLCAQQCTGEVTEEEFGETLLKTLDEWKFCIWTKAWITPSGTP